MNALLTKASVRATLAKLLLFAVLATMNGMAKMTVTAGIAEPVTFGSSGQGAIVLLCAGLVLGLMLFLPRSEAGASLLDAVQQASPQRRDWWNALWAAPFLFHRLRGSAYAAGHLRVDVWDGWGGELTLTVGACVAVAFVTLSYFLRMHAEAEVAGPGSAGG